MIKLVYCIARKADLSVEEFCRYWHDIHGPIGARIPGVRRLVQSVAVHDARDAHTPSFDGMAELWFDDVEAVLQARSSAEWQAATADERHFIDHSRTAYFLSHERTVVGLENEKSITAHRPTSGRNEPGVRRRLNSARADR